MNEESSEAVPPVAVSSLFRPIRNPSIFKGLPSEDPSKWLSYYKRIATFINWDDRVCLANAYFFLEGTAKQWYENNEQFISSWDEFKTKLSEFFNPGERCRKIAEEELRSRAQKPGETTQTYIQHVLGLCQQVDKNMSEEERVSHLMKGIAEDIYQALLTKEINTTADFIKWCQHIERMQQKRITKPKFSRLPNVIPVASIEEADLASLIRQIVREEVQRFTTPTIYNPEPADQSIDEIVQEEVERALAPISGQRISKPYTTPQRRPSYSNVTTRTNPGANRTPRKTEVWRTEDNRPVCFHCGRPGHVVRYCRERRAAFDAYRDRRQNQFASQPNDETYSDNYSRPAFRRSSPGPSRGRSPTRRYRSPSPFRSSSRSPSRLQPGN